jgi:hypothetical protein
MTLLADQLQGFPRNTRWYASWWLIHGAQHPQEHCVISERLGGWRRQAEGCRGELQAAAQSILAEFERERAAAARPSREWVMPAPSPTATVIDMPMTSQAVGQDGGEAGSPLPSEGSPLSRTKMAVCEECGTPFQSQRSTARFCSQACQKRARRAA